MDMIYHKLMVVIGVLLSTQFSVSLSGALYESVTV